MIRIAWRSLLAHKLRTFLTALAIILGVAMISGTYVFTDQINKAFDEIFTEAYAATDVIVTRKASSPAQFSTALSGLPRSDGRRRARRRRRRGGRRLHLRPGGDRIDGEVVETGGSPTLFFSYVAQRAQRDRLRRGWAAERARRRRHRPQDRRGRGARRRPTASR